MGVRIIKHVEVIQEQFHEYSKVVFESCTHCSLINWWNILEPKWHDYPNKKSPIGDECSLEVFMGDHDLVMTKKSIQKQINLMPRHFVQCLFSKG